MIRNRPPEHFSDKTPVIQLASLDAIRSQLANTTIFASLIISIFALIATLCRGIFFAGQEVALLQVGLFLIGTGIIIFYRRLPYILRASLIPSLLFVVGIEDFLSWGLMGMGIPVFMTCCILVTVFFGARSGLVTFAASIGIIAAIGAGVQLGRISFNFDINAYAYSPFSWMIAIIGFCYFLGLLEALLIRLHASFIKLIGELNRRTSELQIKNEQLKEEIIERKQADEALRTNMEYLRLHSDLANKLIKLSPGEFGKTIEEFLMRMVEFFDVDRGSLVYWVEGDTHSREMYSWKRNGTKSPQLPDNYEKLPYVTEKILKGETFSFSNINDLPFEAQNEKNFYLREGSKSVIIIPMMVEGMILGALAFESSHMEKTWSDNLVQQLQLITKTFTHSLERKHAEALLRESEDKFRAIFENVNDEIVYLDGQGKIIDVNKRVEDIFGYKPETIIGKQLSEINFFRPDNLVTFSEIYDDGLSGRLKNLTELVCKRKDESEVIIEASTSLIKKDSEVKNILVVIRDITERKKLESKLQQAQKMEAIGALAGGVAHDLNNILSGIVSYPELVLMNLPEDSPLRRPISTIKKSGEKAASIVNDLLTLARRGVVVTEVVNMNDIISEYLKSPEYEKLRSYHPHIEVETRFEADLLPILGSPVHLSKTVMNLVSNAAEAMAEGGKISISTENRYLDKLLKANDTTFTEGNYVVITVSDTGVGISPHDLKRIFEPFYTKKVMGRSGTGLGMAVVWGTVKDHKGHIDIETIEGKGTSFTLYFPGTRKEIQNHDPESPVENYMGKGASVLVIDDVEDQRTIATEMLEELGYRVSSVSSGEQAVDYMKSHSVDLLVLDMIMAPGIDGLETYKRVLELQPKQKAIIASGFTETSHVKEAQRLGAGKYIKKPYTLEQIGVAVKTELEK